MGRRAWIASLIATFGACVLAAAVAGSPGRALAPPAPWLHACADDPSSWCGTFEVPENRASPGGRRIGLKVVVVPAGSPSLRDRSAVTVLAGGPGQAATDFAWFIQPVLGDALTKHDLLLVDQRGTGGSHRLVCPVSSLIGSHASLDRLREAWEQCLAGLDGDVRFYGTNAAMDDLDAVRETLGYETLHVYGGSYGTVAAQAYLRRHGEHVATVLLDSAVGLDTHVFETMPRTYQAVLDRIVARCARRPACHRAFPDPAGDLATVLSRLARSPASVQGRTVDPQTFVGVTASLTEGQGGSAVIPLFVRTAAGRGVATAIDRLGAGLLSSLDSTSAQMTDQVMRWAITCSEPWARADPDALRASYEGTYLDFPETPDYSSAICASTPRLADTTGLDRPVHSPVPALITMGAEDPKIAAPSIKGVAAALPNAKVAVVRTAGHIAIWYRCIARLANQLMVSGSSEAIDTRCARQQSFPPFVLRWSSGTADASQ